MTRAELAERDYRDTLYALTVALPSERPRLEARMERAEARCAALAAEEYRR